MKTVIPMLLCLLLLSAFSQPVSLPLGDSQSPPSGVVKLVFIHHSTGENWLADENGGLGMALGQNNYFVSDTNYGWGPDGIGDRTDIPNWLEWFRRSESPRILAALYAESGQHSPYTRQLADPGGENQVVLFKSCFPNSNLSGSPGDAAQPGEDLTVANAKYVYNELLQYFSTRPDKLFVVITAPPVANPEPRGADANARAFNTWLVNDWLEENAYPYPNVAVFDFYNVLTAPDNHHRVVNGRIEHLISTGRNTSSYSSAPGDDHPSRDGNLKATQEFVPMLNLFYQRWMESAPQPVAQPPAEIQPPAAVEAPAQPAMDIAASGFIDQFEGGAPAASQGWQAYWDDAAPTRITCAASNDAPGRSSAALRIDFDIAAESWATCALMFDTPQDWSTAEGLQFEMHALQEGLILHVDIYAGNPENRESYLAELHTTAAQVNGWALQTLFWEQFQRVTWEENAGAPFTKAHQVQGMAFGFGTQNQGTIWVDDVGLFNAQTIMVAPPPEAPAAALEAPVEQPEEIPQQPASQPSRPPLRCLGGLLPLVLLGVLGRRSKHATAATP